MFSVWICLFRVDIVVLWIYYCPGQRLQCQIFPWLWSGSVGRLKTIYVNILIQAQLFPFNLNCVAGTGPITTQFTCLNNVQYVIRLSHLYVYNINYIILHTMCIRIYVYTCGSIRARDVWSGSIFIAVSFSTISRGLCVDWLSIVWYCDNTTS